MIESSKTLEVAFAKCWDIKNNAGDIQHKKLAIKCSPEVHSDIMIRNGGYIFVSLCRCKAHYRYFVPQCFHCNELNHFANTCPKKSNPVKRGKCAGQHKTESCWSKVFTCVNCIEGKVNTSIAHEATSYHCPILIREQNQIQKYANYSHEKT